MDGEPQIDLERYCEDVAAYGDASQAQVEPEQVLEVVGGLANLYLEKAIQRGEPELRVATSDGFASEFVSRAAVLQEIMNCSGVTDPGRKETILSGMNRALRDAFSRHERLVPGNSLLFRPFGRMAVIDPATSRYELAYRDPGGGHAAWPRPRHPGAAGPDPLATLIHLSDLHFGSEFTTDETFFKWLLACIPFAQGASAHSYQAARALSIRVRQILQDRARRGVPVCVVFTGDLSGRGQEAELTVGSTFLQRSFAVGAGDTVGLDLGGPRNHIDVASGPGLFVIPGNHDIWQRHQPYMLGVLRRHFPGDYPIAAEVTTRGRSVFLYGLDSTQNTRMRHMLARGRVREEELGRLCDLLRHNRALGKPGVQVVCLHHPLIDPQERGLDPTLKLEERERVARRLLDAGTDLALSGHIHRAVIRERDTDMPHHAVAGTGTQQFSERNFLVHDVHEDAVLWSLYEYDKEDREFVRRHPDEERRAREEAFFEWERAGRPTLSRKEQDKMYLEALRRVRRSLAGWAASP
jgi:3',5'-cyclic AMP phosphodiesterase CpdA